MKSTHRPAEQDRLPPHDAAAEAGALACILSVPTPCEAVAMLDQLFAEDFYDLRHQEVFRALRSARAEGKPLDMVTLSQCLRDHNRVEDVGGLAYIIALPEQTPSAANFSAFLETLRDRATRRAVLRDAGELSSLALDTSQPRQVIADAARRVAEAHAGSERVLEASAIGTLTAPATDDQTELLSRRYLCRGAGALLVGQAGQGKSSLAMQMAVHWSLNRHCFGIRPTRALRVLLVQSENDQGDLFEMFAGICAGLQLSEADRQTAGERILFHHEDARAGDDFLRFTIEPLVKRHRPDLLILDPALAYIPGDTKDAEAVGQFLRRGLNPILHKYGCAALVIHHTTKQKADGPQTTHDFLYAGAGSIEFSNWARCVLVLETKGNGCYRLHAPKRGARIGWADSDGQPAFDAYIRHSRKNGTICWHAIDAGEVEQASKTGKSKSDLLAHVPVEGAIPQTVLLEKAGTASIGQKKARAFLDELVSEGRLHLWLVPRPGTNPEKRISRHPQPEAELQAA